MARRLSSVVPFVVAVSLCLVAAPAAFADTTPTFSFGHDDTRDGDEAGNREIHSGLFAGFNYDPTLQPDAQRADSTANANELGEIDEDNPTFEKFPFDIAPGDENGSFTATVTWQEPAIDLDVYVYRERPNGTLDPTPVAQSASTADPERATRFEPIAGDPIKDGRYWVYVDNWCSNDTDPFAVTFLGGACSDEPLSNLDEDDFVGQVSFTPLIRDNAAPIGVGLAGPDTGTTAQPLSFTGSGTDPEGTDLTYAFDLDGDGRFEYDNAKNPTVTTRFINAGVYNVGLRVADGAGGAAYATKTVTVSGPSSGATPGKGAELGLLRSFSLNRPVFGGKKNAKLVVRYRLREPGRAIVALYRGNKRVQRLAAGNRSADRTYRVNIGPKKLRKGATYTVRMFVRSADGKRTQSVRLSAKRL